MEAVVGGHHLRAGRPEHPSHESAASLPSVAPSAAPSATGCARTNLRKHTTVSPGGGNHGGREPGLGRGAPGHASQTDHPEHESAASTTRVATSAAPSAHELRRTNLRKRTAVRTGGGNQGEQEWGWGQGERRLRGVTGLGRTNRPGVE